MLDVFSRLSFGVLLLIGTTAFAQEPTEEPPAAAAETPKQAAEASAGEVAADAPLTLDSPAAPDEDIPEEPPEEYKQEFGRRVEIFKKLHAELREAVLQQRIVYVRYANREKRTPADRQAYFDRRRETREKLDETYMAALDVLRMGMYEDAVTYIMTMVQHRFERDIYDAPTMEGAARLLDGGSNFTYLFKAAARSAVVAGEFDMARKLMEAIDDEQKEDFDHSIEFHLDSYQEMFEAENKLFEKEKEEDRLPRVAMKTTQGDVTIELYIDQAPSTVAHFIGLVEQGYYDELDFYQVIDHLLALTGDPTGTGNGNCGKFLIDEHDREDARAGLRGSLIMAKVPLGPKSSEFFPNSASSQFAILLMPVASASQKQTIFGRVIEGMDVVSRLRRIDPNKKKEKGKLQLPPDRVIEMKMIRRPDTLPEPNYVQIPARG